MPRLNQLTSEFPFTLPRGLLDRQERLHRKGTMRLATAKDELYVQSVLEVGHNPAYGFLVMLSQVISRLGMLNSVSPILLEQLTLRDITYLREFYNRVNQQGNACVSTECPHCRTQFAAELNPVGEL